MGDYFFGAEDDSFGADGFPCNEPMNYCDANAHFFGVNAQYLRRRLRFTRNKTLKPISYA